MNGNRYLLDTDALINFFQGNPNLQHLTLSHLSLSVISILEFLSFSGKDEADKNLLPEFIKEVEKIDLAMNNVTLIKLVTEIRMAFKIRLPDPIIAASAIYKDAKLISNDKDFAKITSLQTLSY